MKDLLEIIKALAGFPLLQLIVVSLFGLIGWRIWLKATKEKSKPDDGNRLATLFDLEKLCSNFESQVGELRQEIQKAMSSRDRDIYERIKEIEDRLSRRRH